jgi:biotin synthase
MGSAIVLGLMTGRLDAEPTTVYLLTYRKGRCQASCLFCPQSRLAHGRADMLARIVWPVFQTEETINRISKAFQQRRISRVCIQALNYPSVVEDLVALVSRIRESSEVPISVSCQPLSRRDIRRLADAGVQRIGIPLDAATEDLFNKVKGSEIGGPYEWKTHLEALRNAVEIFGRGNVTTHLIAGLGEEEEELVEAIQRCVDMGVYPALFAFTPIPGTALSRRPPPPIEYYRRIQVAHYLITHGIRRYEDMTFRDGRLVSFGLPDEQLREIIKDGGPFMTTGCPGCNRPYYNERPSGPLYNIPRRPTCKELAEIEKVLCGGEDNPSISSEGEG